MVITIVGIIVMKLCVTSNDALIYTNTVVFDFMILTIDLSSETTDLKLRCPVDRNTFITSQSTHETRFHFQDFEYAGHPDSMLVHCNATFCKSNDYSSECEPQCKHNSTAKEYRLNGDSSNESSSKFRPLYVAGVIIVALAMICVLVALSIYFRRKKIRNTS
ncbi:unnamed protein product [Mytilus coruscus]|uniref:ZP domain-containing protein n=1 Tax=Mytilus coruscus TaxID=42192 RepID=A0A6J8DAZ1_MYTCO|nr:unnamed protein product [Mytilus coruscus]